MMKYLKHIVWGLLAFIKASDERTYAVRRKGK